MSNSMTGYGKSKKTFENYEIEAEIRSLNNRYLDTIIRLPKSIDLFEQPIKNEIKKRIFRGKVTLNITLNNNSANGFEGIKLNEEALQYYYKLITKIKSNLNLSEDISLDHILQFKDLMQPAEEDLDDELLLENILITVNEALDSLIEMRNNEAVNIVVDIDQRIRVIEKNTNKIIVFGKDNPKQEYDKLYERVQSLLNGKLVDENRLEMELSLLADRVDVTEECTRLISHIQQFDSILKTKKEVGKSLTFILQEMHRETNTIGSKTTNVEISHLAIGIKEEIEKLREQIQNLE
ncbi:MAG: YicC family protein [Calditrichia bacterium]|nr:YicC family protein [Calditrichia bacterium]